MSKMSEMSFSFSLNVILSMSKMSKMSKMLKMEKEHTHTFLYRVCDMSKMSEMSFSFSLNVDSIYVKDVKDRSNTPQDCNAMYVEDVEDSKKKYTYTFLLITSLIFNGFSICKKFWKAET